MARRRDENFLDEVFDLLKIVPWWAGPIVIFLGFALFQWGIPAFLNSNAAATKSGDNTDVVIELPTKVFARAAAGVAPIIAGLLSLVWLAALIAKFNARKSNETTTNPTRSTKNNRREAYRKHRS